MYIKLKTGEVKRADTIAVITMTAPHLFGYSLDGKDNEPVPINSVESVTDARPVLISSDQAASLTSSYLNWSDLDKEGMDDDEIFRDTMKTICHDIMDYLCHTNQILTPSGFWPMLHTSVQGRVKVVQANLFRDGGTIEYKDRHNRSYFVPAPAYGIQGIYPEWSMKARQFPDMYRLKDIELEIVPSLTSAEVEGEPSLYVDKNHPDYKGDLGQSQQLLRRNDGPHNSYVEG